MLKIKQPKKGGNYQMKILIYGMGVIGSLHAVLMSKTGYNITVLARGKRLADLLHNLKRYYPDNADYTSDKIQLRVVFFTQNTYQKQCH